MFMSYTMLNNDFIRKYKYAPDSLEGAVLSFIREWCEELRFDKNKATSKDDRTDFDGTSLKKGQIPFNMEKDIDRLCLENAVARFLKSGKKEDAFDVYFCYLEMFVGDYKKTRRMIELLSEFEANGSSLLMKHRDHFSHSVYVFCLGLAIYQSNPTYRMVYEKYMEEKHGFKKENDKDAACHYLKYWGLASLFHDIGYPFELPFEQVCSYFEVEGIKRSKRPYVAYHGLESFTKLNKAMQRKIGNLLDLKTDKIISTTNELFAYLLSQRLGEPYYFSEDEMLGFLNEKPTEPNKFGHYMDHAYFSATVLFKKLFEELNNELTKEALDSLTAIILHNSLYKFCIAYYTDEKSNIPFKAELHPLAFMLMLCDELQCWDRTAYGRNSKLELHPMDCRFTFSGDKIVANYIFDKAEQRKIDKYENDSSKDKKLKAYSSYVKSEGSDVCPFLADIQRIVDLNAIKLEVTHSIEKKRSKGNSYISNSNFINLYNFAVVLNGRWDAIDEWKKAKAEDKVEEYLQDENNNKKFIESFGALSLEYKLSNINQAKAFAKYMNKIGCFYTNANVDFKMVTEFSKKEIRQIGVLEHQRWLREHYDMGWTYGNPEKDKREFERKHWDMIPDFKGFDVSDQAAEENYKRIGKDVSKAEQDKDKEPMECMLAMLKMFDGLRIYRLWRNN